MQTVTQDEAIANLPQLIDDAARRGEEVIVLRDEIAVAKIVPLASADAATATEPKPRPQFGSARGLIRMREDFDAPLDDFKDYV